MPLPADSRGVFKKTVAAAWQGLVDISTGNTIKLVGINAAGVAALDPGVSGSQFLSQIAAANRTHQPTALANYTFVNGVMTADNLVQAFDDQNNVNGATEGVVAFLDGASEATSDLLLWWTDPASFPLSQDGTDDDVSGLSTGFADLVG